MDETEDQSTPNELESIVRAHNRHRDAPDLPEWLNESNSKMVQFPVTDEAEAANTVTDSPEIVQAVEYDYEVSKQTWKLSEQGTGDDASQVVVTIREGAYIEDILKILDAIQREVHYMGMGVSDTSDGVIEYLQTPEEPGKTYHIDDEDIELPF